MSIYLSNKKYVLFFVYLVVFVVTFKDTLTGYPFGTNLKVRGVDDLVVLFLFLWMCCDFVVRRSKGKLVFCFFSLFLMLFLLHIVQTVLINKYIILKFVLFFRDTFWYFPLFYFSYFYLDEDKLFKIIKFFFITQLLFLFFQQIFYVTTHSGILWEDDINGSLGAYSSHILAYTLLLILPVLIFKKKSGLVYLLLFFFILSSARSALLFLIISYGFFFVIKKFSIKNLLVSILIFVSLILPVYKYWNANFSAKIDPLLLISQQQNNLGEGAGAARVAFFLYSVSHLDNLESLLLGKGSGEYASRTATKTDGYLYLQYLKDFPFENEFISGGTAYNAWLVELGLLGFILILLAFFVPVLYARKSWYFSAAFLIFFMGLSSQKLTESYAVSMMYWLVLAYYTKIQHNFSVFKGKQSRNCK